MFPEPEGDNFDVTLCSGQQSYIKLVLDGNVTIWTTMLLLHSTHMGLGWRWTADAVSIGHGQECST